MPAHTPSAADTNGLVLFENHDHRWTWLGEDSSVSQGVAANQYLIEHKGRACLLDPGSVLDFARAVANLARYTSTDAIDLLFYSHQDPDVASSAPMWAAITPARLAMPALWTRFLPHFGAFDPERIEAIPDAGAELRLAGLSLRAIPAHFLHAPGANCLYDPRAGILFTGDVGANIPPPDTPRFIDDFQAHLSYLRGFHERYMAGNAACQQFVRRLDGLNINMICPQHGSIYRGAAVRDFLDWLRQLRCGMDLFE